MNTHMRILMNDVMNNIVGICILAGISLTKEEYCKTTSHKNTENIFYLII